MFSFSSLTRATLACALSLALMLPASAQPQEVLSGASDRALSSRTVTPDLLKRRNVRVSEAPLASIRDAGKGVARLSLFDDATFDITISNVIKRSDSSYTMVGRLVSNRFADVILSVEDGVVVGDIKIPGRTTYELRYVGDGIHEARQVDESAQKPCGVSARNIDSLTPPKSAVGRTPTTAADPATTIDVMVVYTTAARVAAGGTAGMLAQINTAIAGANLAYQNSLVTQRLSLVHTYETLYVESGSMNTDLVQLRESADGHMDEVHTLRDLYRADFVHLLTQDPSGAFCGLAYLLTSSAPDHAFGVTWRSCISNETFTHELGHNMGCAHDRDNAGGPGRNTYSYGYRWTSTDTFQYRSVMAYAPGSRVKHFSNPDVNYIGAATGLAIGNPLEAHNAQTLNNSANDGANYRQQNDNFANRIVLPGGNFIYKGRNFGHTKEGGEPNHAGDAGGRSSWWSWTPSASGTATITTVGSGFDTLLSVYTGGAVNSLTLVAENDDIGGGNTRSSVTFAATSGTPYRIAVDGKGGAFGEITLDIVAGGSPIISRSPTAFTPSVSEGQNANSQHFSVGNVGGGTLNYTISDDVAWLSVSPGSGSTTFADQPHTITYNTSSLTPGGYSATITITDPAATNNPQTISVNLTVMAIPPNDNFANAQNLPGSSGVTSAINNTAASLETGEPTVRDGQPLSKTLWYSWQAPASGPTQISTLGSLAVPMLTHMDTVMGVYTGTAVNALTVIAENDDAPSQGIGTYSLVTFNASADTVYKIQVGGWNGATGDVVVTYDGPSSVNDWSLYAD